MFKKKMEFESTNYERSQQLEIILSVRYAHAYCPAACVFKKIEQDFLLKVYQITKLVIESSHRNQNLGK